MTVDAHREGAMNVGWWLGAILIVTTLASNGHALVWSGELRQRPRQLAQAMLSPSTLLGTWRCQGSFQGSPVVQIETYTPGNFRTVLTVQGQQIIVGGTYKAASGGDGSLLVSFQPADWRPRQICSGPGGIGGNCVPVSFGPSTEQLFFRNPDSYRTRLGSCRRME